ncbi:MAG: M28 family peptidase [Gemmatimonadales bacterium]
MIRRSVTLALLAAACASAAPPSREFDGAQAMRYVQRQLAFGPRIPGTAGHDAMALWLDSLLKTRADSVIVQSWMHSPRSGPPVRMQNFLARFNPAATHRVLFLAHWDTRPRSDGPNSKDPAAPVPGADDGASGVAVLLGMADAMKKVPASTGVDLLFVDGEDFGDFEVPGRPDVLVGARYYADHLPAGPMPAWAVLFDMVGDKNLALNPEGYSVSAAPELVERVWGMARTLGHGDVFPAAAIGPIIDDHIELQRVGIRAVDVIDLTYDAWHTKDDTADKLSVASLQAVGDVGMGLVRTEKP